MGSITTFYSYKGGVGRSMALANVALLLAKRGKKVLVVDFDLEAPGLERYFSGYFPMQDSGLGLMRLFMDARSGEAIDYRSYTSSIDCGTSHPIELLSSGREQDHDYSRNLESFDWAALFSEHRGGDLIESLRKHWREDFDLTLIDSRTGLSDTGGICTIQLPDVVVAMFTANYQSLYGVRDVMRLAQDARQRLAYDRMPLTVLPLPARWGTQEFKETQVWLGRIAEAVDEFCDGWLPKPGRARDVVEQLKIPQRDYFGFGEKLAAVEQGASDPSGMGYAYDRIASILASDFAKIDLVFEAPSSQRFIARTRSPAVASTTSKPAISRSASDDYRHDVYVSYERSIGEQAQSLVEDLRELLAVRLGREAAVFFDLRELEASQSDLARSRDALTHSRILLALLSPSYVSSTFCLQEYETFERRSLDVGRPLVFCALMRGDLPPRFQERLTFDLRDPAALGASSGEAFARLERLADELAWQIEAGPPFDAAWIAASGMR